MEGYLFKRTSNAFKTWNRRWFCMKDNKLYHRKRSGEDMSTIMEEDLRICHVRRLAHSDRRFYFEVLSPNKSHTLQADTEEQMQAWISALHRGIDNAIHKASVYSENIQHRQRRKMTQKIVLRRLIGSKFLHTQTFSTRP